MRCPKHPNETMTLLLVEYVCDVCRPPFRRDPAPAASIMEVPDVGVMIGFNWRSSQPVPLAKPMWKFPQTAVWAGKRPLLADLNLSDINGLSIWPSTTNSVRVVDDYADFNFSGSSTKKAMFILERPYVLDVVQHDTDCSLLQVFVSQDQWKRAVNSSFLDDANGKQYLGLIWA